MSSLCCVAIEWTEISCKGNKHNGANKHIERVKLENTHTQAEALLHVQLVIHFNNGSNNNNIDNNNKNNSYGNNLTEKQN